MGTEHNQPDSAIDKTLAALNTAVPPEGLEGRIAARIAQRLEQPAPATSHWRTRFTGYTLTAAWWRGAAIGAATAMLAVAVVLLLQHKTPAPTHFAANAPATATIPVKVSGTPAAPCAHPAILRVRTPAAPASEIASSPATEVAAPSHPAPVLPLTAQERELVRLAKTTDPRVLAALNSETQARLEAENHAQFEKFFTPPPPPPPPADAPAANPVPNPESSPAANPEATPEAVPAANPEPESANPEASPSANE
jgi:hypothetical protein